MSNPATAGDTVYVPEWTFADKFRKARQLTGMDQRDFAAALELTASTVASYETGRSNPRFRAAADLAKRLQLLTRIDYRWFLDVGGSAPAPAPIEVQRPSVKTRRFDQPIVDLAQRRAAHRSVSA